MNRRLRALLIDDERLARKHLRSLLAPHPEVEIVGEADGVSAALALAERERPDVLFLDVQMPPDSGFDLLPRLSPLPSLVFVTAHDAFAVRAFEANALDYLLKPVHPRRLAETIRRLLAAPAPDPLPAAKTGMLQPDDLVVLRDKGAMRMVQARRIAAIEAEGSYSLARIAGEESMLILRSMADWESFLPNALFARISRSLLINLSLVRAVRVRTRDETEVVLEGVTAPLTIGRAASARLRKFLRTYPPPLSSSAHRA